MKTKMMMAFAAAALVSTQAVAAPVAPTNAALSLSTAKSVRVGSTAKRGNKLAGTGAIVVAVLAAGAIAGAVIAITDDNDSDSN